MQYFKIVNEFTEYFIVQSMQYYFCLQTKMSKNGDKQAQF
jgi:hypothetical protein